MRLNTISSPDGWHFDGKQVSSHRSYKTVSGNSSSSSGSSSSDTVLLAPALAATASTVRRGGSAVPVRLEGTSPCSPSLCAYLDGLVLAWTGTDGRPNLLHLRG